MMSSFGAPSGLIVTKSTPKNKPPPARPAQNGNAPSLKHKSSSSSLLSRPSSSLKPRPAVAKSKSPLAGSSASPRPSPLPRKKRTPSPIRSESSSSDSEAERRTKRPKTGASAHSRTATATPAAADLKRGMFALDKVDERGEWGRGWTGFTRVLEAIDRDVVGWKGGKGKGKSLLEKYLPYFPQPGFENAEPLPSVELLYPGGARERFILLNANAKREYSPILELRSSLQTILDLYIPPSHAHIFGTLSTASDIDATSTPEASSPGPGTPGAVVETIADALRKALAPNRRDGPGFIRAMERFNLAFGEILADGSVEAWLKERNRGMESARWSKLVDMVHEQVYSRVVAPYYNELEHHPKHPEEVARAISDREDSYGELRHNFMSRIIAQTNLGPHSTFVDLGSGVGNCVIQASLEAGCRSFGVELLPVPARCARLQLREAQRRWAMWGLKGNLDVHVAEGDFRGNGQVARWLQDADVVLVNNEVFPPSLNEELTNMFLDLKEGAIIVSLKPFVTENFKMTINNCDSFGAIVNLAQHTYYPDWVTWKGDSGKYYTQVIDRSRRKAFEEELSKRRRI